MTFENDSQFTDNVLLHMSATLRRVGITVPTNGFTVCMMHGNSEYGWSRMESL